MIKKFDNFEEWKPKYKIGDIFYWIWNPDWCIPDRYANSQCKLIEIKQSSTRKLLMKVKFLKDDRHINWWCDIKDLKTEDEMLDFYIKQEENREKYQDIDPYGEEIWEKHKSKKIFENFEIDNSKIWIIGVPSGEALLVDRDKLNELYNNKLIKYSTQYSETGFFVFNDNNKDEIMNYISPKIENDYIIYENQFGDQLIKMIKIILDKYPFYIELYVNEGYMTISYEKCHIMIKKNVIGPKYKFEKRNENILIDVYNIQTDKLLMKRIEIDLNIEL